MTNDSIWQQRYSALEEQVEHMLIAVASTATEDSETAPAKKATIRKLAEAEFEGHRIVYCVADGENLGYSFEFARSGDTILETKLSRLNSHAIPVVSPDNSLTCRVTVTSFTNGDTAQKSLEVSK